MEEVLDFILPCLFAFGGCVGFSIMYNIHGVGLLICGLGGSLGWAVYLTAMALGVGDDVLASFIAAMAIGVYSEVMARLRRCPVTAYLLVALLPLVPGAGIYYTMRYCVEGETQQFISSFLHTVGVAASLSVGAMLASSLLRPLWPRQRVQRQGKTNRKD